MAGLFSANMPDKAAAALKTIMSEIRPAATRSMAHALAEADLRAALPAIGMPTPADGLLLGPVVSSLASVWSLTCKIALQRLSSFPLSGIGASSRRRMWRRREDGPHLRDGERP
jgi:hypothetical protein